MIVDDSADKKLSSILKNLEPCMSGGRLDIGRLSRSNSTTNFSPQNTLSLPNGGGPSREDSQTSLGFSALDVDDSHDTHDTEHELSPTASARNYLKIIDAHSQPRLAYSTTKKSLELIASSQSLLPPISNKIAMFRNRYHLVHQRLMRNELFQTSSFLNTTSRKEGPSFERSSSNLSATQQGYKLTPVANLLGRSGSAHLLLGMLVSAATGDLALTDLTGSVLLDLSSARPVQEEGAWYCPGMIVLVEGVYEEDGGAGSSSGGGVGGMIGGRIAAVSIGGPPAERRDVTLGLGKTESVHTSVGAGFGWVDFLGVGSERAVGEQMRIMQQRLLGQSSNAELGEKLHRTKIAVLGECTLDNPRTLEAVRGVLNTYIASGEVEDLPIAVVLMGNFVSAGAMAGATAAGGGSMEYKEQFDALAAVLVEFPTLLSSTTFVFVPGDNDPWPSSFSGGAATAIPREGVPEIFTSRIRRAVTSANQDAGKRDSDSAGEAIWASNPSRLSLFGPVEEIVLFRDDVTGKLRRSALTFPKLETEEGADIDMNGDSQSQLNEDEALMEIDITMREASHLPSKSNSKSAPDSEISTQTARKLVKTVLDQGHLSPFPLSTRPVFWDYASSLSLYPLPTALVLADAEAPAFAVKYEGCLVMNPGKVVDELGARKGLAKWVEYDVRSRKGAVKDTRF